MVSARDEATPPEFKELVERYYEVLSKAGQQVSQSSGRAIDQAGRSSDGEDS